MGRRAEAESWTLRLEAETGDPPATASMETGRPVELAPYRCEQRGCQMTAVEEAGAGRWVDIFEPPGFSGLYSRTKALPGDRAGWRHT